MSSFLGRNNYKTEWGKSKIGINRFVKLLVFRKDNFGFRKNKIDWKEILYGL